MRHKINSQLVSKHTLHKITEADSLIFSVANSMDSNWNFAYK
jgi:hypothetical protein